MTMARRKTVKRDVSRWAEDPDKAVSYEFQFNGHPVKPGQKFKLKNDRLVYTFHCLVHNIKTGTSWVECVSDEGYHSFRPEKVFKLVGIKRSYTKRKKNVN